MIKTKLTLSIHAKSIEKMKIQAIKEKKTVSEITEHLWREYLSSESRNTKGGSRSSFVMNEWKWGIRQR